MNKIDLTKQYKSYYTAKSKPEFIEIEKAQYLSIRGKGDPSGELFAEKISALYLVAYGLKFMFKDKGRDFTVAKLEALWWFDELLYKDISMADAPTKIPRSEWEYRLLIRLPDFVSPEDIKVAKESAQRKKNLQWIKDVDFYEMNEGKCIQILHTGPFDNEPETLEKINEFSVANQLVKNGPHHEIYLSDFRKTSPDKLKTILREPVM